MKVLILRGPGTNCDAETAYAFQLAGASTETIHLNRILEEPRLLDNFQVLCLPGGFSFGDDLGAGRVFGYKLEQQLGDILREFHERDRLILGICNGFQILLSCGLLVAPRADGVRRATLAPNDCGQFLDRWVYLETQTSNCVFLRDISRMVMPMAHAEGKFLPDSPETGNEILQRQQIALKYTPPRMDEPSLGDLPANPNGSWMDTAGACDPTGRVLGLMPHPERNIRRTHHFQWTRLPADNESNRAGQQAENGLRMFRNAVDYFS